MKFQPMKIGVDTSGESIYNNELNRITGVLSEFKQYVDGFISINDYNVFKHELVKTFTNLFVASKSLPSDIPANNVLSLYNVDVAKLNRYQEKLVNATIDVDYNSLETESIDFGIYTENEQENKLFTFYKNMCDKLHEANGINSIYYGDILRAFNGTLVYDHSENVLLPNIHFIKGTRY